MVVQGFLNQLSSFSDPDAIETPRWPFTSHQHQYFEVALGHGSLPLFWAISASARMSGIFSRKPTRRDPVYIDGPLSERTPSGTVVLISFKEEVLIYCTFFVLIFVLFDYMVLRMNAVLSCLHWVLHRKLFTCFAEGCAKLWCQWQLHGNPLTVHLILVNTPILRRSSILMHNWKPTLIVNWKQT